MSKTSKFIPLATICGGFAVLFVSGFFQEFKIDSGMFNAIMYAGLGGSAAVGFAKWWKKD